MSRLIIKVETYNIKSELSKTCISWIFYVLRLDIAVHDQALNKLYKFWFIGFFKFKKAHFAYLLGKVVLYAWRVLIDNLRQLILGERCAICLEAIVYVQLNIHVISLLCVVCYSYILRSEIELNCWIVHFCSTYLYQWGKPEYRCNTMTLKILRRSFSGNIPNHNQSLLASRSMTVEHMLMS